MNAADLATARALSADVVAEFAETTPAPATVAARLRILTDFCAEHTHHVDTPNFIVARSYTWQNEIQFRGGIGPALFVLDALEVTDIHVTPQETGAQVFVAGTYHGYPFRISTASEDGDEVMERVIAAAGEPGAASWMPITVEALRAAVTG